MIKFTLPMGTQGTAMLVGLGLSDENLRRLRQGQPIVVRLAELLPELEPKQIDLLIFAGRDEREMTAQLSSLIGPSTQVRVSD